MGNPHVIEKVSYAVAFMILVFGVWIFYQPDFDTRHPDKCKTNNAVAVQLYWHSGYVCVKNTAITEVK